MNIHIGLVAYALNVIPLIESLDGDDITWHLFLHSQRPDVVASCMEMAKKHNVLYHPYGTNRGLAVSWNDTLIEAQEQGADTVIILNDDVVMSREDLLILANAAVNHPECGVIVCEGYDGGMERDQILQFVVFAVNKIAIQTIGYFDQNLIPYCFEDSDYSLRCGKAGVPFFNAGPTGIVHIGHAAVKTVPALNAQNQRTFPATLVYYKEKWGGEPGEEKHLIPFGNPHFGLRIDAAQLRDPYPGFGRTDTRELIKL